jgi:hypothetical protein
MLNYADVHLRRIKTMRLFTSLIATAAILFSASTAFASATWTVAATASGGDLNAMAVGDTLTLDIKLETSAAGEMIAIAGSVNNYNTGVVSVDAGASTVAADLLFGVVIPGVGSFNGVSNLESAVTDTSVQGPGQEDTFLSLLGTAGAGGDGTAESAQFQIVYDVIGAGTTTLRVGTFADYADAFSGASDNVVNNAGVSITVVPEPGTALLMGLGLAGLAAAGRRE